MLKINKFEIVTDEELQTIVGGKINWGKVAKEALQSLTYPLGSIMPY